MGESRNLTHLNTLAVRTHLYPKGWTAFSVREKVFFLVLWVNWPFNKWFSQLLFTSFFMCHQQINRRFIAAKWNTETYLQGTEERNVPPVSSDWNCTNITWMHSHLQEQQVARTLFTHHYQMIPQPPVHGHNGESFITRDRTGLLFQQKSSFGYHSNEPSGIT